MILGFLDAERKQVRHDMEEATKYFAQIGGIGHDPEGRFLTKTGMTVQDPRRIATIWHGIKEHDSDVQRFLGRQ